MDRTLAHKIETNVERLASALFSGAVAYAAYTAMSDAVVQPRLGAFAGGAFAAAYLLCTRLFIALGTRAKRYPVPVFDVRTIEPAEVEELLLTEADRVDSDEPLVLDDVLAEIGPQSRVVRLFDRSAMPTPGQLKARIDDHLDSGDSPAQPDASQALSDALANLRRALR